MTLNQTFLLLLLLNLDNAVVAYFLQGKGRLILTLEMLRTILIENIFFKSLVPTETLISRDIESIGTTTFVCCCLLCLFCFFLPGLPRAADEVAYKQSRAVQAEHWTGSFYLPAKQK